MAKSKKAAKAKAAAPAIATVPAKMVPIASIDFAKDNREQIDKGKLDELAASLQEHGLRDDIHLRPNPTKKGRFECVDGERRTRAAKAIGWKEISAKVEEMDDAKAKELRLVHHLQRENLSPWDEARQLTALKELNPDVRIEDLAAKVGRGPQWVAQRLAVGKLMPGLRELVVEQDWPLGHLPLLARVPADAQPTLLDAIKDEQENGWDWRDNGGDRDAPAIPTQHQLEQFLDERSRLLTAAPWSMDDAELLPKAGACAFCPKRSSAQSLLFPDLADDKDDRCLDAACWAQKQIAFVAVSVAKLKDKGQEPLLLSGTYGSRRDEDNSELRELIGQEIEIKDPHHYRECKKKDPGAVPALLMADLHRAGFQLRKPPAFRRYGIPGSGGPDFLRNDYEFIVCTSNGRLPWSDNTAMGHVPKWAPGGAMSNRNADGVRKIARDFKKIGPGRRVTRGKKDGDTVNSDGYDPPEFANPGNVISLKVGGNLMGHPSAHLNEAPFPEALPEFFVRSFCPPGGMVMDPFLGSGTTAAVATRWCRNFMGCDIRADQVKIARERVAEETPVAILLGKDA